MKVVVATHQSMLDHDTGPRHPERPARLEAAMRGVRASGLEVQVLEAPRAARSDLTTIHDERYVDALEAFCLQGGGHLDYDTVVSEVSWEAATRSVGAVLAVVEELEGESDDTSGLALTRPPGHHALRDRAMGFCMFNNVAIAAARLRSRKQRVAILDWDVHHGNGTQAVFGDAEEVLYVSLHQDDFYPYEGHLEDIDAGAPGTIVNVPLPSGTAGDVVREAWESIVMPVVTGFGPDWVLVSAGYDAHQADPIGGLGLVSSDYQWMAFRLSEAMPANRIVLALEGGYDLTAIEESVSSTLSGLSGQEPAGDPNASPARSRAALAAACATIGRRWTI